MRYIFILFAITMIAFNILIIQSASAQDCSFTIEKVADPEDDTPFNFFMTGNGFVEFTLMDPSDNTFDFSLPVSVGVTVTEEVTPGWRLDDVSCTVEGDVFVNTDLQVGHLVLLCEGVGTATCQFINVTAPSNVPTLSEWGMISAAVGLGLIGLFFVLKHKRARVQV